MLQAKTGGEGVVNTATVRKLIDIRDRIEHAAAYARTDFYLAGGNDGPNAYATVIENGPVIGINPAMIELFATDWDAYAGMLSHLYAHLRKAGFDLNSALGAWQRMVSVSTHRPVPFLGTHPATEQRIAIMRKLAAQRK